MKVSDFIFDCVHLLYYQCHRINFKQGASYLDSPDRMKNKKATINLINKKYSKCFQDAVTVALNHQEIKNDLKRVINYPSENNDQKKFSKKI